MGFLGFLGKEFLGIDPRKKQMDDGGLARNASAPNYDPVSGEYSAAKGPDSDAMSPAGGGGDPEEAFLSHMMKSGSKAPPVAQQEAPGFSYNPAPIQAPPAMSPDQPQKKRLGILQDSAYGNY